PAREMRSGLRPVTSASRRWMLPLVGGRSPESRLVRVDLPAPLGPMTAWMVPRHSSSDTSCTAARPPKRLVRFLAESRTSGIAGPWLAAQDAFDRAEQAARRECHHEHDEQAHPQLPVLADPEVADVGQVLEQVQQVLEGEGADDGAGEIAHATQDHHHD